MKDFKTNHFGKIVMIDCNKILIDTRHNKDNLLTSLHQKGSALNNPQEAIFMFKSSSFAATFTNFAPICHINWNRGNKKLC